MSKTRNENKFFVLGGPLLPKRRPDGFSLEGKQTDFKYNHSHTQFTGHPEPGGQTCNSDMPRLNGTAMKCNWEEIYVPRILENAERKKIKCNDVTLKQRAENRNARNGGGYFHAFGDNIPERQPEELKQRTQPSKTPEITEHLHNIPARSPERPKAMDVIFKFNSNVAFIQ